MVAASGGRPPGVDPRLISAPALTPDLVPECPRKSSSLARLASSAAPSPTATANRAWRSAALTCGRTHPMVSSLATLPSRGAWQDHARGCDLVVNTAAVVGFGGQLDAVWRANVLGTRRMIDAAARGGAERFVQFSSVTTFGFDYPDGVDETYPVRLTGNPYPDTKIASEQVTLQAHVTGEVEATIVRPGDVYGPRSRGWTVLPVNMIKSGQLILPAGGRGQIGPVYVDNLVDGVTLAAAAPKAVGEIFTIADGITVEI